MIVKSGDKWLVKDSKGEKTLGTHPTKDLALHQLRAIEANKNKQKKWKILGE
jgi:hypothetical protein